jgi:hypothetical protein
MRKRAMDIPPKPAENLMTLEPQWMKVTIGKPRSPVPDPSARISRESSSKAVPESSDIPAITPPPQVPARFPRPEIYQDPEVTSSAPYSEASNKLQAKAESPPAKNTWTSPPPLNYYSSDLHQRQSTEPGSQIAPEATEPKSKSRFLKKFMKGK